MPLRSYLWKDTTVTIYAIVVRSLARGLRRWIGESCAARSSISPSSCRALSILFMGFSFSV